MTEKLKNPLKRNAMSISSPEVGVRKIRHIDREYSSGLERSPLGLRQLEESANEDTWGGSCQLITDPSVPLHEVRVVTRKAQEQENVLGEVLTDGMT
ncbi:MAG: hypothetical protein OXI45_03060 [Acidobacteriota bacterium]|nr:hypothetical protein [Acidobacteriota bacterium]